MAERRLLFRSHALTRMAQRGITVADVREVLRTGLTIETRFQDLPLPTRLVVGWRGARPLHVVAADHPAEDITVVITVYQPDPSRWDDRFRRRKR